MPAEWEPHEATWLGWPHNGTDWPGKLKTIEWVYGEMVRKMAPGEIVRMLVDSPEREKLARGVLKQAGVDIKQIEFLRWPTNRGWMRDSGPIFVRQKHDSGAGFQPATPGGSSVAPRTRAGSPGSRLDACSTKAGSETAIVHFHFNAWAKYPNWQKDRRVPDRAARLLGKRLFNAQARGKDFVLEGGGIEVNGRGTLLTTEECYLDPKVQVRNPGLSRKEFDETLRQYLGVTNVLWLVAGPVGDDTHGHIDDICRFVNHKTMVLIQETNSKDVNYLPLSENWERVQDFRLEDGSKPEVVPLPMPAPLFFGGDRLPASYANFYISNAAVIVPTFNDPNDRIALGILGELFKDRPVVGIHAVDLVLGFGTLHCLTQQQPV